MEIKLSAEDRKRIKEGIGQKYARVAENPEGFFSYPTGRAGLEALKYDPEIIQALPEVAVESYCGVGNPFSMGAIHKGETVLDIGCGGGVDTLIAAMLIGPEGTAVGIDTTPEMLERAKKNLKAAALKNARFEEASAEDLPFPDESFDVVTSNGAFNLIPDKAKALEEVFRVLKPQGRLMIADQVLTGGLSGDLKARVDDWFK